MRGGWPVWALIAAAGAPGPLHAEPLRLRAVYNVDVAMVSGRRPVELDKLLVAADAAPRPGLRAHVSVLNVSGGQPNARAGTVQGVDNIEVLRPRLRLYAAWLEQDLGGGASLRFGMQDFNEEFYATDTTDLLNSPTFGIGAEMGASGVNGPSIFPSSALGARVRLAPVRDGYLQLGVFNAKAGSFGDPGGVDTRFREGVILAAEGGWTGRGRVALGAWRYSRRQPLNPPGPPGARATSQGAYLLVEQPLGRADGPLTAFLRTGVADGDALPMTAAGEAGVRLAPALPGRPDSELALGVAAARVSGRFRDAVTAAGRRPASGELLIEATVSDRIAPHLKLQPDVQYIRHAGARRGDDETVVILRLTAEY